MTNQIYDRLSQEWYMWEPLNNRRPVIAAGLGSQAIPKVTALGTCGDPSDPGYTSHRTETLFPTLASYEIDTSKINNPEVETWDPSRAPVEGIWAARSEVVSIPVTNQTAGAASLVEAGLIAYGGILRGQRVFSFIELNDKSPEETRVARELALTLMKATQARFPFFTLSPDISVLANQVAVAFNEKEVQRKGAITQHISYDLPPLRDDFDMSVYLSGSSGKTQPEWMNTLKNKNKALKDDVPVDDSFRENWNTSMIGDELLKKLGAAVQIEVVTDETEALGALAETGTRIMQADLSGQSYGLLIARDYTGDGANAKDSRRARILALEHLQRLQQDFPTIPVFVTDSLDDLALFATGQYLQQHARQTLSSSPR